MTTSAATAASQSSSSTQAPPPQEQQNRQQAPTPTQNHEAAPTLWHIFVCNAFLIPSFMVNKDNATCALQDDRAAALGRLLMKEKPDVFMAQEFWGSSQGSLEKEISKEYSIGDYCASWFGFTFIDSIYQHAMSRGGLYFAHRNRSGVTACGKTKWGSYSVSKTKSKKGFLCQCYEKEIPLIFTPEEQQTITEKERDEMIKTRRSAPSTRTKKTKTQTLLVFNTHDDPMNVDDVQMKQMEELGHFIHQCVLEHKKASNGSTDFSAVAVGDFNFAPGSQEYKRLFGIMKDKCAVSLREILPEESLATHTYDGKKNALVQWKNHSARLDHIFAIDCVGDTKLNKVELVKEKVLTDTLVSDHFPFIASLKL